MAMNTSPRPVEGRWKTRIQHILLRYHSQKNLHSRQFHSRLFLWKRFGTVSFGTLPSLPVSPLGFCEDYHYYLPTTDPSLALVSDAARTA